MNLGMLTSAMHLLLGFSNDYCGVLAGRLVMRWPSRGQGDFSQWGRLKQIRAKGSITMRFRVMSPTHWALQLHINSAPLFLFRKVNSKL